MAAPVSISFSPVPGWLQPGVSNHHMAAPVPHSRPGPSWPPFPLCQPVFRLVSRPCLFPSIPFPNSRPFPLCQPVFRLVSAITPR